MKIWSYEQKPEKLQIYVLKMTIFDYQYHNRLQKVVANYNYFRKTQALHFKKCIAVLTLFLVNAFEFLEFGCFLV
jgi:hypothetical protein